jgi:hypothetical protein
MLSNVCMKQNLCSSMSDDLKMVWHCLLLMNKIHAQDVMLTTRIFMMFKCRLCIYMTSLMINRRISRLLLKHTRKKNIVRTIESWKIFYLFISIWERISMLSLYRLVIRCCSISWTIEVIVELLSFSIITIVGTNIDRIFGAFY